MTTTPTPGPSPEEIGQAVYDRLRDEDRAALTEALQLTQDDDDGDWHCALGNLGYGWPVGDEPGVAIDDGDLLRMCIVLAELRMHPRTDDSDWGRLLGGAFGKGWDHVRGLYAAAGSVRTKPRLWGL